MTSELDDMYVLKLNDDKYESNKIIIKPIEEDKEEKLPDKNVSKDLK